MPIETEDLRNILLLAASASAAAPQVRARTARLLRATLVLLEEEDSPEAAAQAHALREIAENLGMAAEHAAFLARGAGITRVTPR